MSYHSETCISKSLLLGKEHIFRKVETNHLMIPYDYTSAMHYGRSASRTIYLFKQKINLQSPTYRYATVAHVLCNGLSSRYAFAKGYGKLPTIIPKPDSSVQIGGARQMSRQDIVRVNRLYYLQRVLGFIILYLTMENTCFLSIVCFIT